MRMEPAKMLVNLNAAVGVICDSAITEAMVSVAELLELRELTEHDVWIVKSTHLVGHDFVYFDGGFYPLTKLSPKISVVDLSEKVVLPQIPFPEYEYITVKEG